jgi:hypothetical protein
MKTLGCRERSLAIEERSELGRVPGVRGSEAYVAGPQSGRTADTNASWIVLDCYERRRNAWLRDIEGTHLDKVIAGRATLSVTTSRRPESETSLNHLSRSSASA